MIGLKNRLEEISTRGESINIAIVGAGLMGKGLVSQLSLIKGMKPVLLADRTLDKAVESFRLAGIDDSLIEATGDIKDLSRFINQGKYVATNNISLAWLEKDIDIVVDATGNPDAGAEIALNSIENKKHIVMLNVEADSVIGPILNKKARENKVVYTGTAGDEPGSVKELYDFATLSGFEVIGIGKGKNNPIDYEANYENITSNDKVGLSPRMLAGFIDGTNTMIEMAVMGNATGFTPDIRGGHGIRSGVEGLGKIFSLEKDGGIMSKKGVIDYVHGIAPGVFVIVTSKLDQVHKQMEFLKMGKGPNYVLYRPYHLTSLETPVTIARAVLENEPTIAPNFGPVCEVIAIAKKDIKAGENFDFIGGKTMYGSIDTYKQARRENLVPIGLINSRTKARKDIKKGEYITYDMVDIDKDRLIYKLRMEQDRMFN